VLADDYGTGYYTETGINVWVARGIVALVVLLILIGVVVLWRRRSARRHRR
jgi:hypothetical protein